MEGGTLKAKTVTFFRLRKQQLRNNQFVFDTELKKNRNKSKDIYFCSTTAALSQASRLKNPAANGPHDPTLLFAAALQPIRLTM